MKKEVKINLRIDVKTWERFKRIARKEDLSASQMIRRFIRSKIGGHDELTRKTTVRPEYRGTH